MRYLLLISFSLLFGQACSQNQAVQELSAQKDSGSTVEADLDYFERFVKAFQLVPLEAAHIQDAEVGKMLLSDQYRGLVYFLPATRQIVFPTLHPDQSRKDNANDYYVVLSKEVAGKLEITGNIGGPHLVALTELAEGLLKKENYAVNPVPQLFPVVTQQQGKFLFQEQSRAKYQTLNGSLEVDYKPYAQNKGEIVAVFSGAEQQKETVTIEVSY